MGLIKKLKTVNWGYLWLAVLIGGAGILILAYPNKTLEAVAITVGVVTLLLGAVQAIRVLSDKKRGFKFAASLVCLFLIIDASFKLQTVVRARQFKSKACWALMVLSIVTITLSFITIRLEGGEDVKKILILFGLSLVADALGNLFSFFFVGVVERAEKNRILAENAPEPPAANAEQGNAEQ